MKNSMQNYKLFFKTMLYNIKIFIGLTYINIKLKHLPIC